MPIETIIETKFDLILEFHTLRKNPKILGETIFDDPDEKMTRDEIEYMLTNSEATLDADEIEMLQGIFSLDEMVAREVMVPRTDAFMVDINDDTKEIIESILKQNFSRIPGRGNPDRLSVRFSDLHLEL